MIESKVLAQCLVVASLHGQVPVDALLAIMEVEAGRSGLEVKNVNGTYDLGIMQINTCWLPALARAWSMTPTKARLLVRDNDCLNIAVAARILKIKIQEAEGDILQGIARYNSANPRYGRPYLQKVMGAYFRQKHKLQAFLLKENKK